MLAGRSYLFLGATLPEHYSRRVDPIDRLVIDATSLDIKAAREIVAQATQQPFGTKRLLVLERADVLSEQIQNTLLKLLEEPPLFLVVVLVSTRPASFLPTVRSRLHLLGREKLTDDAETNSPPTIAELRAFLDSAKDRLGLTQQLESIRRNLGRVLLAQPSANLVAAVDLLDRSVRRLGQNANQKLVVDALLLNWPL